MAIETSERPQYAFKHLREYLDGPILADLILGECNPQSYIRVNFSQSHHLVPQFSSPINGLDIDDTANQDEFRHF